MKKMKISQTNVSVMAIVGFVSVLTAGCGQSKVDYKRDVHETTVAAPQVVAPDGEEEIVPATEREQSLTPGLQGIVQRCIRLGRVNFQAGRYIADAQSHNMPGLLQGNVMFHIDGGDQVAQAIVNYLDPSNFTQLDYTEVFRNHMGRCIRSSISPTPVGQPAPLEAIDIQINFNVDLYGN